MDSPKLKMLAIGWVKKYPKNSPLVFSKKISPRSQEVHNQLESKNWLNRHTLDLVRRRCYSSGHSRSYRRYLRVPSSPGVILAKKTSTKSSPIFNSLFCFTPVDFHDSFLEKWTHAPELTSTLGSHLNVVSQNWREHFTWPSNSKPFQF